MVSLNGVYVGFLLVVLCITYGSARKIISEDVMLNESKILLSDKSMPTASEYLPQNDVWIPELILENSNEVLEVAHEASGEPMSLSDAQVNCRWPACGIPQPRQLPSSPSCGCGGPNNFPPNEKPNPCQPSYSPSPAPFYPPQQAPMYPPQTEPGCQPDFPPQQYYPPQPAPAYPPQVNPGCQQPSHSTIPPETGPTNQPWPAPAYPPQVNPGCQQPSHSTIPPETGPTNQPWPAPAYPPQVNPGCQQPSHSTIPPETGPTNQPWPTPQPAPFYPPQTEPTYPPPLVDPNCILGCPTSNAETGNVSELDHDKKDGGSMNEEEMFSATPPLGG